MFTPAMLALWSHEFQASVSYMTGLWMASSGVRLTWHKYTCSTISTKYEAIMHTVSCLLNTGYYLRLHHIICFTLFFEKCSVAQVGFKIIILLPRLPQCSVYQHVPPGLAYSPNSSLSMCGATTNVSRTDSVRLPVPPRNHLGSSRRPARGEEGSRRPLSAKCLRRSSSPLPGPATAEGGERRSARRRRCGKTPERQRHPLPPPTSPRSL